MGNTSVALIECYTCHKMYPAGDLHSQERPSMYVSICAPCRKLARKAAKEALHV